ncbi:MAG: hypothetical protein AB7T27_05925 [Kiritimatiellia bacterium]
MKKTIDDITTHPPVATKKRTSYENFAAECPSCGQESVFNRASDLCTFEPIAGRDVICASASCGKPFRIIGDTVNCAHEMLVYDAYDLFRQKRYMNCILTLATAYEVFFSLFMRVNLLYRPFGADDEPDLHTFNRLSRELHGKIKDHTFGPMRALFLWQLATQIPPENLVEAEVVIAALPKKPKEPADEVLEAIGNSKLVPLLKAIKHATVNTLRNEVVHKRAYRPKRGETKEAMDTARSTLLHLSYLLDLHDNVNMYRMASSRTYGYHRIRRRK